MVIPGNVTIDGHLKVKKPVTLDGDDTSIFFKRKNKSCYALYAASDGGFALKKMTNKNRDPYAGVGNNNGNIRTSWDSGGRMRPKKGMSVTGGGTYLGGTEVTGTLTLKSSSNNRKWVLLSRSDHSQFQIKGKGNGKTTDEVWFAVSGKNSVAYWGSQHPYLALARSNYNTTNNASTNSTTMVNHPHHKNHMMRTILRLQKMGDSEGKWVNKIEDDNDPNTRVIQT